MAISKNVSSFHETEGDGLGPVTVKARMLARGQLIACPRDGREENVVAVREGAHGAVMLRTNRHDHNIAGGNPVTIIERKP